MICAGESGGLDGACAAGDVFSHTANNASAKYGAETGILRHIVYVIFPYCQHQPQARVNSITTSPASGSEVL